MKNMSFALTTEQVQNRTKTLTRRIGWTKLQPGRVLQPVAKGMDLRAIQELAAEVKKR